MKPAPLPSKEKLHEMLIHDQETGKLYCREREGNARFNGAFAGKEAFVGEALGYLWGRLNGRAYRAHRVIWKMMFGTEPPEIDHINGDRRDNKARNLRAADRRLNMRNLALRKDNSSGHIGVSQTKDGTWRAYIHAGGKSVNLGHFPDQEMAAAARKAAQAYLGYHPNHGRKAGF